MCECLSDNTIPISNQKYRLLIEDIDVLDYLSAIINIRNIHNNIIIKNLQKEFDDLYQVAIEELEKQQICLTTKWVGKSVKYIVNNFHFDKKISRIERHTRLGKYTGELDIYLELDPIISLIKAIQPIIINKNEIVDNDQLVSDITSASLSSNETLSNLKQSIDKYCNERDEDLNMILKYLQMNTKWQTIPVWYWTGSEYIETNIDYFDWTNDNALKIYINYTPQLGLSDTCVPIFVCDIDVGRK